MTIHQRFLTVCLVLSAWLLPSSLFSQDTFQLLTDASQLQAGDEIIIANTEAALSLSTTQNTNNRGTVAVTIQNQVLTPDATTQIITLEGAAGAWLLNVGDGYLYAASSSKNWLRTDQTTTPQAQDYCTISVGSDTTAYIAFTGEYTHNNLRYNPNNGKPLFSCYLSTSTVKDNQQIYWRRGSQQPEISRVTSISDFNALEDGTEAQLYLPDEPQVRVVYINQDTVMLSDNTGLLKFVGVETNPTMNVDQHVAGYITGKKQSADGFSLFVPTSHTNSAFFVIAEPVTEIPLSLNEVLTDERTTPSDLRIYNLRGQFVGTDTDTLPNGIYVRDGKKLIINK
ncbi:MAG: hypothetical protein ACOYJG_12200 [Prevotella sp.]|jgi:hypothetical protein